MSENSDLIIKFYNQEEKSNESHSNPIIIDDKFTFIETGHNMFYQKLFTCKTCRLRDGEFICEIWAKKCHKGHRVPTAIFQMHYLWVF